MSLNSSRPIVLILATLAILPAGCSDEPKLKDVPASQAVVVKKEDRIKSEMVPKAGSSAGMNYNPGGPPPGTKDVD
jgi:hypothetical protein